MGQFDIDTKFLYHNELPLMNLRLSLVSVSTYKGVIISLELNADEKGGRNEE